MILYLTDPKKTSTPKFLDTIINFSKVGHKSNLKKSVAFLYQDEQIEKEYRKSIPLTVPKQKIDTLE
jgi:hypothetical protein